MHHLSKTELAKQASLGKISAVDYFRQRYLPTGVNETSLATLTHPDYPPIYLSIVKNSYCFAKDLLAKLTRLVYGRKNSLGNYRDR